MGYTPHVLVTGIDPVGAAIARDFAVRGLDVTLVDARPLDSPGVGRLDGLLASGAQFARDDPQYARRCLRENRTLFETAPHCIGDTGGLVLGDDLDGLLAACRGCGITPTKLSGEEALEQEPALPESVTGALAVPDASIDPYLLTVALVRDAYEYGADIRPQHRISEMQVENGAVQSVTLAYDPPWDRLKPNQANGEDDESDDDESASDADVSEGGDDERKGEDDERASDDVETEGEDDERASDDAETEGEDDEKASDDDERKGEDERESKRADADTREQTRTDGGVTVIPGLHPEEETQLPGGEKTGQSPPAVREHLAVDYVVNAGGPNAVEVAETAGCSVPVSHERVPVVVSELPAKTAITRPAGTRPDSVVPVGENTLIELGSENRPQATTAAPDPAESVDEPNSDAESPAAETNAAFQTDFSPVVDPSPNAVDEIVPAVSELVAEFTAEDILRAETVVRYELPLGKGRDFAAFDHAKQDCWGLLTVLGGTVTTHRWVAEKICDRVCEEFGILRECKTDELLLPGSEDVPDLAAAIGTFGLSKTVYDRSKRRLGSATSAVLHTESENPVLCESQSVTRAEIESALIDETTAPADLSGVRVRTGAGTGEHQGGRCAHRLATTLYPAYDSTVVESACTAFLAERWSGQRPVAERLEEMAATYRLQVGILNREMPDQSPDIDAFDDGIRTESESLTCCPRVGGWER